MVHALFGGMLIGLSAAALLLFHGRIVGISGIVEGAMRSEGVWRRWFLVGLIGGGAVLSFLFPWAFSDVRQAPASVWIGAGLLVGFGTRLGNGCTSGHGVCGIGRLSPRSIVATLTFMATGALTVFVMRVMR